MIVLAIAFFAAFVGYSLWRRLPADPYMYRRTNRAHFNIFLAYVITASLCGVVAEAVATDAINELLLGAYVYYSLYYVFLFPLIGLARNSISINLLTTIRQLQEEGQSPTSSEVAQRMKNNNLGAKSLRESRLYQLTYLGFARESSGLYTASVFGVAVHRIAVLVLTVWKQGRL